MRRDDGGSADRRHRSRSLRRRPGNEMSAVESAAAVRAGERSARTVVEEHLAAIEARDPEIHAFTYVLADEARVAADAVDASVARGDDPGALAGVPVALKDNMCTRGIPTTCSSKILEGWRPPYSATVVERVVAAGGVPIGKTNLGEFAMGSSSENSAFGPTRNPRRPDGVRGGWSGGSAAAVAAGFAAVGLGSDTGGSIRQPAALSGVVGIKPTYGLVSRYGLIAFASSLDQIGPLTDSVDDASLLLEVIAGHDPLDSTSISEPASRVRDSAGAGVDGLRVGIVEELADAEGVHPDVAAAVEQAALALEEEGAAVERGSVPSAATRRPACRSAPAPPGCRSAYRCSRPLSASPSCSALRARSRRRRRERRAHVSGRSSRAPG